MHHEDGYWESRFLSLLKQQTAPQGPNRLSWFSLV